MKIQWVVESEAHRSGQLFRGLRRGSQRAAREGGVDGVDDETGWQSETSQVT